jgi:hypothetical protein
VRLGFHSKHVTVFNNVVEKTRANLIGVDNTDDMGSVFLLQLEECIKERFISNRIHIVNDHYIFHTRKEEFDVLM